MKVSTKEIDEVKGNPIFRELYPEGRQFLEVRWLPHEFNRFTQCGIEVAALVPSSIPHIKTVPIAFMMFEDFRASLYKGKSTIVVDSSGNAAHAVALLARAFGFKKVVAVMPTDVPESKAGILKGFGNLVDVLQVADVAGRAREEGAKPGHFHLNQYAHMGNVRAHECYTGPEVVRALGGDASKIALVAIALGSGGTVAGVGRFFRKTHSGSTDCPKTLILGVRPKLGEQVPGARDEERLKKTFLPWEDVVDSIEEVSRKESFMRMRRLWRIVHPQPGATSGLAWGGLEGFLHTRSPEELESFRGKCVAFLCPDDGRFYPERTTGELDPDQGA